MEPVYFDQLFKRNNRGNYIQRDEPLPTNWRHHDRIIALWIKNNPVKINFDDPNLKYGEWARMAFEGSWSWGSQESRTYPIYPRYGLLI